MISENAIPSNYYQRLLDNPQIEVEMAVIKEWVIRDPSITDNLMLLYVAPCDDGTIEAACSCLDGACDRPCLHAAKVITEIKDQPHLLRELFRQRAA